MQKVCKQLFFILLLFSIFVLPKPIYAQTNFASGDSVILSQEETIDDNYFAAGGTVLISGRVNGDAYVAGGTVVVDGVIDGDLIAAGGNINITGTVTGDIRTAGGQITVSGDIGRNATLIGGSLIVQQPATITGSVVSAGALLTLNNSIGGNVTAAVEQLNVTPQASVSGTINYWSENQAKISQGANLAQEPIFHQVTREQGNKRSQSQAFNSAKIFWAVISLLTSFVIGLLFQQFLPVYTRTAVETIEKRSWISLGIGFLTLVLFPFAFVLLLISLIGIPIAFFALFSFISIAIISKIFVAMLIGQKIIPAKSKVWQLLLGLTIYMVISLIPVINWVVGLIVFLIGTGAIIIAEKHIYTRLRHQNSI